MRFAPVLLLLGFACFGQIRPVRVNPTIRKIVSEISAERIAATLKKLESFGTRHAMSAQEDPERGIGAAKRWIHDEFQSYSPRLEVSYDSFQAKKGVRLQHDVELANVVAVLPGTTAKEDSILITAHYDSLVLVRDPARSEQDSILEGMRKAGATEAQIQDYLATFDARERKQAVDWKASAAQQIAPGVTDDASGTAAVMELARVMSKYQFEKTLVFIAFACEECGLVGSRAYAKKAKQRNMAIEAVLNNDIIGSAVAGNGTSIRNLVRVFSDGPEDSPSRAVARYAKQIGEAYVPSLKVDLILRPDRFARGGDHTPFHAEGFGAVRFTTPNENFANQHSATDTFANTSVPFTRRVAQVNAAAAASLALAPNRQ
jgi:Predicted aminopeptidases